ncbi:ABC transporter substrate-binding protein [Actinopolymorpha pittospori]|uniref:Peptide/nickel transport system substrate-binding protein n=1 Tax=Actinopolymorpha pittospori TaxID=648752 RepID=A0A927RHP5_9ACTN|nr:ABC transporter substrate-binding protein [Actinopolymorpha pittospori]MBE1603693.1 peptide/nickel transport system substrate-binding protein [Actinopolymorpha pittospori]
MPRTLDRRRFVLASLAGIGGATVLGGCGVASGAQDREDTLIVSVSDTINQLSDVGVVNPFLLGTYRTGWQFAFEPLFFYNPWWTAKVTGPAWLPGKDGVIPYLATGFRYNADYTEIEIDLRPGVSWSDGKPFTARDVAFTLEMLKASAPQLNFSFDMNLWIKRVDVVSELRARIFLNRPNPRFMMSYLLWRQDVGIPMVPEHIFKGKPATTFTNFDIDKGWPVVTGPWKLVNSTSEQKVWERRDDWWGAKTGFHRLPAPKRVVVLPLYSTDKLTQLLASNKLDATHNIPPANAKTALRKNPDLIVRARDQSKPWGWLDWWTNQLGFNCSRPPFDDPDIRMAINYALDREEIIRVGFDGDSTAALLPLPSYPSLRKFRDLARPTLESKGISTTAHLEKTNQIMESKGYRKDPKGLWAVNGKRFPIVIMCQPGFFESYLPIMVAQLRRAGFDAGYKALSTAGSMVDRGEIDAFMDGNQGAAVSDPYGELETLHGRYSAPAGKVATYPNRWKNPEYDHLVEEMGSLPPEDPRFVSAYEKAIANVVAEAPVIPLVDNYLIMPVSTKYWHGWPDESNPYCAPSLWHRTAGLVINSLEPAPRP